MDAPMHFPCAEECQKIGIYGKSVGTNFPRLHHAMSSVAFSHTTEN